VSDRESPRFTRANGPLMARRLDHVEGGPSVFQASRISSRHPTCLLTGRRRDVLAAETVPPPKGLLCLSCSRS